MAVDVGERCPARGAPGDAVARATAAQVVARGRLFATHANNGTALQRLEHFLFMTCLGDLGQLERHTVAAINQ